MKFDIKRLKPRPGKADGPYPYLPCASYPYEHHRLGRPDPTSKERKLKANCTAVRTLDEAADLIENHGYHIRMGDTQRDASLIQPCMVRVVRTP